MQEKKEFPNKFLPPKTRQPPPPGFWFIMTQKQLQISESLVSAFNEQFPLYNAYGILQYCTSHYKSKEYILIVKYI